MRMNIDDALTRLASDTPHSGLAGMEERVLNAITSQPAPSHSTGATLAAAGLALALGVFSNIVPSTHAQAAQSLAPFGALSPLAPSSLLVGSE